MIEEQKLLSVTEFAAAIGKSERTVNRYVKQGRVSTLMMFGSPRIPLEEVERFIGDGDAAVPTSVGEWHGGMSDANADVPTAHTDQPPMLTDTLGLVPLDRYEVVVTRLGYIEGQLDMTRRMLTDGGEQMETLRKRAEMAERQVVEMQIALEAEKRRREEIEAGRPWWRKLFDR